LRISKGKNKRVLKKCEGCGTGEYYLGWKGLEGYMVMGEYFCSPTHKLFVSRVQDDEHKRHELNATGG